MANNDSEDLSKLRFFQTQSHDCGYLEQKARNIFVDPAQKIDTTSYSFLSANGFRRSGYHVYRPNCQNCKACTPLRVIVNSFSANQSQRRCLNKNKDLRVEHVSNIDSDEFYQLFERYIHTRHADGEMYPPSRAQYEDFLCTRLEMTQYFAFRDRDNQLKSVAIVDALIDGLSAMYSFFDPDEPKRSLGKFNILYQISLAKKLKLPYVYLGYWIASNKKMSYKTDYRPYQIFKDNCWHTVDALAENES